jgi:hypothetical protein
MPMPTFPLARLGAFRAELHACFARRADALFELGDALLCAPTITSVAQLSLEPTHRRGCGSAYDALASGRINLDRLRDLLATNLPDPDPLVFAVEVTTWPRCDAECSPARGYYYQPSRHSAGQPIIAGWDFQWVCQLSFDRDSWTAPVDAQRLHPLDDTDQTAAAQIHALLGRLPVGVVPLFVFDAGYDSAQLTLDLADAGVAVLVRLRSDRCFSADPLSHHRARPAGHAAKFAFADPTTWPTPTATLACQDDQYGTVTVHAWNELHPKQQRHPGHGTGGPRPIVRGTIIRAQVERGPARTRPPKVLVAVVGRPCGLEAGSGPGLARLHPQVRPRAHRRFRQADARLDHPTSAPSRAGRPVDLVGAGRIHPAAHGPRHRQRPAAAVGAAPTPAAAVTIPGPARVPRLLCALGSPTTAPKPAGAPRAAPRAAAAGPRPATTRSRSPPTSPGRTGTRRPPPRRPPDRPTISTKRPPTSVDGSPACPKGQLRVGFRSVAPDRHQESPGSRRGAPDVIATTPRPPSPVSPRPTVEREQRAPTRLRRRSSAIAGAPGSHCDDAAPHRWGTAGLARTGPP